VLLESSAIECSADFENLLNATQLTSEPVQRRPTTEQPVDPLNQPSTDEYSSPNAEHHLIATASNCLADGCSAARQIARVARRIHR
jgi:hypothetical protein